MEQGGQVKETGERDRWMEQVRRTGGGQAGA